MKSNRVPSGMNSAVSISFRSRPLRISSTAVAELSSLIRRRPTAEVSKSAAMPLPKRSGGFLRRCLNEDRTETRENCHDSATVVSRPASRNVASPKSTLASPVWENVLNCVHKLKRQSWNWWEFACQNKPTGTKGLPGGDCLTIVAGGQFSPLPDAAPATRTGQAAVAPALLSSSPRPAPVSIPSWIIGSPELFRFEPRFARQAPPVPWRTRTRRDLGRTSSKPTRRRTLRDWTTKCLMGWWLDWGGSRTR
jgi:hypothetical protein